MRPQQTGKLTTLNTKAKGEEMNGRGFTLVELLVVLAVGSILLAIAIPSYAFLVNTNRLAAATNALVSSLQLARSEAIKRATRVTVCKSSNAMAAQPSCNAAAAWQEGWIIFVDGGTKGMTDGADEILRVYGPGNITYTASNFNSYISFLSHGRSQGPNGLGNGTFSLCLAGELRKIILNSTGRIRLEKGTC
jgi:type IV fimbrial biogenesis protein FimT